MVTIVHRLPISSPGEGAGDAVGIGRKEGEGVGLWVFEEFDDDLFTG